MASKTRYTEEFRQKVVDETKKGELTLEAVAEKYSLTSALLKYWMDNDRFNDFCITLTENTNKKESFLKVAKRYVARPLHWLWKSRWVITGCFALLFIGGVLINLCSDIVESEKQDNQQPILQKLDSLITTENDIKEQLKTLETLDSTLNVINEELVLRITPLMTIQSNKPICNCKKDSVK